MGFEFERAQVTPLRTKHSELLATGFREIVATKRIEQNVFTNLEDTLHSNSFETANPEELRKIFVSNTLLTRSEEFSKVIDLLEGEPIELTNTHHHANMCVMASGAGFTTAMSEGFGGSDVGNMVKTVVTFRGDHLTSRSSIPMSDDLWRTKPSTAHVSLGGQGTIMPEDVVVISLRFPVYLFPEKLLTENEQDELDAERIKFVVRHYTRMQTKTTH